MIISVSYGSYVMQSPTDGRIVTRLPGLDDAPPNRIQSDTLAEADGALVVKQQYGSKPFSAVGVVRKDSIPEMEREMDAFKVAMSSKNQAFDVDFGGGKRRWLANAKNLTIARRQTSFVYTVEFESPDGMGWDLESTTLLNIISSTTSSAQFPLIAEGSYQVEPLLVLVFNTLTGSGEQTVSLSNGTSLRGLSIKREWTEGDIMEINSLKQSVFVNNIPTPFAGQFPKWDNGAGYLNYVDTLATRDVAIQGSYTKRHL